MNTPFQILRNRAERAQQLSEEWLQEQAQTLNITPSRFLADTKRLVNRPMLGRMYMFQYDPKLKESLPFYDTFPLTIPFLKLIRHFEVALFPFESFEKPFTDIFATLEPSLFLIISILSNL